MAKVHSMEETKWFSLLQSVRKTAHNNELLSRYFLTHGSAKPQLFYELLREVKGYLSKKENRYKKIATRYLEILSPLAERFGFYTQKGELDDMCFDIIEPHEYRRMSALLAGYQKKSKHHVKRIITTFDNLMRQRGLEARIAGRYKNIYSIYRKIQKKYEANALSLKDIFAFRIILKKNTSRLCFEVANILHDLFIPIPDFFKDYISIPKINGYQSLHTGLNTVVPELDLPIEVQIRTAKMDRIAEYGVAAHWLYATEKKSRLTSYLSTVASRIQSHDYVFFLSCDGDLFRLPTGSCLIDFAYAIHTEIGNKAINGIVNGLKKPLSYKIQDGDCVKMVTEKKRTANPEWLSLVITKLARKRINEYLKKYVPNYA